MARAAFWLFFSVCTVWALLGCELADQAEVAGGAAHGTARSALLQPITLPPELGAAPSPWPMRGQDAVHTGRSSFAGPDTAAIRWQADVGTGILSRGIKSSVAVASNTVLYVGSQASRLHAISAFDGTELWAFRTGLFGSVESSPAVAADGTIYFGANDKRLYALGSDGTLRWRFKMLGAVRSSPTIAGDGSVVFGSDDGRVYALTPNGELRWRFQTWGAVRSTPAIGFDGRVYVASKDTRLYSLRLVDGARVWKRTLDLHPSESSPAIGLDGTVYVGSDAGTLFGDRGRWAHIFRGARRPNVCLAGQWRGGLVAMVPTPRRQDRGLPCPYCWRDALHWQQQGSPDGVRAPGGRRGGVSSAG